LAPPEGRLLCDQDFNILHRYGAKDGVSSEELIAVGVDSHGSVWCSSHAGLHRIDLKENRMTKFSREDGLQDNEFNGHASIRLQTGLMIFGGVKGGNAFYNKSLLKEKHIPQIKLDEVSNMGKAIDLNTEAP